MELPDLVNPHHTHGWWTLTAMTGSLPHRDTEYCIPPKPFWIHTIPKGTPRYTDWNELLKAAAPQIEQRLTAHVLEVEKGTKSSCLEALLLQLLGLTRQRRSPKVSCLKHRAKQPRSLTACIIVVQGPKPKSTWIKAKWMVIIHPILKRC